MAHNIDSLLKTESHSTEAERTILGALLIDPEAIFKIDARVQDSDFHDPIHAAIYKGIHELSEKGIAVDFVTVTDKLQGHDRLQKIGGSAYLAQLTSDIPTSSHIEQYAEIVLEHSRKRQLARIGRRLTELAYEKGKSATELKEQAEQEFLKILHEPGGHAPVTLGEMCSERYEHYAKLHESDDATKHMGTRTGLPALDDLLIALAPGDFTLLAARPHMGKTALALNIARNVGVDQKGTVGFFSLEMSKEQLFDRMFGSMAGVAPWKIAKGMLSDDKFEKVVQKMEQLEHPRIHIDDDPNHSLTNIRSKARRLHMQHPLDLLIIDYLQLIRVTNRSAQESQNMKLTMISESIKQLARELGVPILALSQMNREADRRPNHKPQLSDLRDSGSLEQDADHVLMLYSEDYYADDDDVDVLNTDAPRQIDLFVKKNRPHGLTGRVRFDFDKETMNFSSVG